jgi:hypothetical protein
MEKINLIFGVHPWQMTIVMVLKVQAGYGSPSRLSPSDVISSLSIPLQPFSILVCLHFHASTRILWPVYNHNYLILSISTTSYCLCSRSSSFFSSSILAASPYQRVWVQCIQHRRSFPFMPLPLSNSVYLSPYNPHS